MRVSNSASAAAGRSTLRPWLLAGVSGLALAIAGVASEPALAGPSCAATPQVISSDLSGIVTTNGAGIAINPGVVVTGSTAGVLADLCNATSITNAGTVLGEAAVAVSIGRSVGTLANEGALSALIGTSIGVVLTGGSIGTLSNAGTISGSLAGVGVGASVGGTGTLASGGSIGLLVNTGTITSTGSIGGTLGLGNTALINLGGTIGTVANAGLLGGGASSGLLNVLGSIGSIGNTGTIGGSIGIANLSLVAGTILPGAGVIGTIDNSGLIGGPSAAFGVMNISSGGTVGGSVTNGATITSLVNTGTITTMGVSVANIGIGGTVSGSATAAAATIASLDNRGLISGTIGVLNLGVAYPTGLTSPAAAINQLSNSGTITGTTFGVLNLASAGPIVSGPVSVAEIGTLTNSGTITGGVFGVGNLVTGASAGMARIGMLSNSGFISGGGFGIANQNGVIGALVNSGTITGGSAAIFSTGGGLGQVTNSGVILGTIMVSNQDLVINGGSGSTFGVLSGGVINVTDGNLLFGPGNQQLAEDISVAGGTGMVTNSGNLLLASSQTITGNYTQTSGANLIIGVAQTSTGRLNVSGTVNMANANVVVQAFGGYRLPAPTRLVVVDAATPAGTSYAGVTAHGAGGYRVLNITTEMVAGHYDLLLTVSPYGYTQIGRDSGARSGVMGGTLDDLAAGTTPEALAFQRQVLAAIDALPEGKPQQDAVRQTAPLQTTAHNLGFQLISNVVTALVEGHQLGLIATGAGGPGVAAGSAPNGMQMWAQVMGGVGSRATNSTVDGYSSSHGGMMVGLDWNLRPNLLIGAGLSVLQGRSDLHGVSAGGKLTMNSYQLSAYGTYRVMPNLFVYGQVGAGANDFAQVRSINFLGARARAKYDGQIYQGKIGLGYDLAMGPSLTLTPMAGLHMVHSTADAYAETGAGVANLRVNASSANALTHDLGARLLWRHPTSLGLVTPEVRLAWTHDYIQGAIPTSGLLAGSGFYTRTQRISADGARVNLGATLAHHSGLQLRLAYEGDLRGNYNSHSGLLRASLAF